MLATAMTPVHPVIHSPLSSPAARHLLPTPATIQPRLHHRGWRERVRFSNDGFCDSPASISLSRSLTMGLVAGDATLSYRGLDELGLGIRQAWDLAADNLVMAARCPEGTCFYLRDAVHTGLIDAPPPTNDGGTGVAAVQVKVPGAPVTSWLAHPRTFTILHLHLQTRLGPDLVYLAPLPDLLIACAALDPGDTGQEVAELVTGRLPEVRLPGEDYICATPLIYRLGFPAVVGGDGAEDRGGSRRAGSDAVLGR